MDAPDPQRIGREIDRITSADVKRSAAIGLKGAAAGNEMAEFSLDDLAPPPTRRGLPDTRFDLLVVELRRDETLQLDDWLTDG